LQVRLSSLNKLRLQVDAARRKLDRKGQAALASITNGNSNTHATHTTAATTPSTPHQPSSTATGHTNNSRSSSAGPGLAADSASDAVVVPSGLSASWAEAAVGVAEGGGSGGLLETQEVLQHDLQRE
jgi:hypothetical protein